MWAVFDVHVCDAMFQLFSLYRVGFLIIVDNSLKANVSQENQVLCHVFKTILNCFALEHSAFKTKHLKVS